MDFERHSRQPEACGCWPHPDWFVLFPAWGQRPAAGRAVADRNRRLRFGTPSQTDSPPIIATLFGGPLPSDASWGITLSIEYDLAPDTARISIVGLGYVGLPQPNLSVEDGL